MRDQLDNAETRKRWIQRAFIAAVMLACGIALANNQPNPDLWGHVRYAQDAVADGRLIHDTATHTFTAEGYRWINHEILSEFAMAGGYAVFGASGLVFFKTLLGFAVLGLMLYTSFQRRVSFVVACIFLLIVSLTLSGFWSVRPQLFSFVLLAIVAAILNKAFDRWVEQEPIRFGWLWAIPPLLTIWANSHGAFLAGLCIVSAYLGIQGCELLVRSRGSENIVSFFHLFAIGVACWLCTLLNPYGFGLHLWLAESLGNPRPEITEWASLKFSDEFFLPFAMMAVLTVAAIVGSKRKRDWAHVIILMLCMWQAISHVRHIALFAVLAGFWVPVHLDSLMARLKKTDVEEPPMTKSKFQIASVVMACVFVLLIGKLGMSVSDLPVPRERYPVDALQFMADNDLEGRLVVSFDWAQYALAALAPDTKVQFDGRFRTCYPQEVIDMHFDFLIGDVPEARCRGENSGPFDPLKVLQHGEPNLVLVDRRFRNSVLVMEQQQTDFALLYQDKISQVWGRRSLYDNPESELFVANECRDISDRLNFGSVTWPAFPGLSEEELAKAREARLREPRIGFF